MGRPTERQIEFQARYAATGDHIGAAQLAGYPHPIQAAHRNLNTPSIMAEVLREQQRILVCDVVPAAVACLASIIRDPHAPTGARVNAAKVVMDRAYAISDGMGKEPHEMSADELGEAIAKLEAAAAAKAREVQGEVIEQASDPDPFA